MRGPVTEDIYAVVNKKGPKGSAGPDTPDSVYEVSASLGLPQAWHVIRTVGLRSWRFTERFLLLLLLKVKGEFSLGVGVCGVGVVCVCGVCVWYHSF